MKIVNVVKLTAEEWSAWYAVKGILEELEQFGSDEECESAETALTALDNIEVDIDTEEEEE